MKLRSFLLIFLVAISFATAPAKLNNLSITTTLNNTDASGALADIQSDALGSYFDGVEAVTSFLTTNGYNGSDGNQGDYYFRFHFHLTRP
jgi:hypothetical protein